MNSSVSSVSYLTILCWLFLITSARWLPLTFLRLIDKLMMAMCLTSSMFSFGPEQAAELEHTFATALHVAGIGNWGLTWLTWAPKFPQFCSPFCVISRNMRLRSSYSPAPICQLPTAGGLHTCRKWLWRKWDLKDGQDFCRSSPAQWGESSIMWGTCFAS